MNTKIVKLDINRNLYDTLTAKQGDTQSRFLLFQLLDGAIPFSLENRSVRVYAIKPDGTEVFNDLIITDAAKGYCVLELTTQMLASPGTVKLELMVIEGDKKLTSNIFYMDVKESINSEKAIVSTNEFGTLLTALASLNEYDNYKNEIAEARDGEKNLLTKVKKLDEQLDNIVREVNTPLRYGELILPSDFPKFEFDFYRDNDGKIKHNFNFNKYKKGVKIYVSENGNDNNDGTKANPFKTLTKALTVASSGESTDYVLFVDVKIFKRDECVFTNTIVNKNISIVGIAEEYVNLVENKYSIKISDLNGNWNTNQYPTMPYATTIGDTLTKNIVGNSLKLKCYCDNRSGIFEIKLEGNNNTYIKTIDLYNTVAGNYNIDVFKDIEYDNYKLTLTYKGQSPQASESRGYVLLEDFITTYEYDDVTPTNTIISTTSTYSWTLESNNTYKATRSGVTNIIDRLNKDIYGLETPLLNVSTKEECVSTAGTWYTDDVAVWVHRTDNLIPTFKNTIVNIAVTGFKPKYIKNSTIYFENITLMEDGNSLYISTWYANELNTKAIFNKCKFIGCKSSTNKGNGLAIDGIYRTYLFDCISAYSQMDGFNYHYSGVTSIEDRRKCLVVEYNCKGYDLGLIDVGNNSNQTSTGHEGCSILRIGTIAGNSSNSCITDVNGCYSILYDCNVSNTRENSEGFTFSSDSSNSAKALMINCSSIDCKTSLSVEGANTSVEINNFKYDGSIIVNGGTLE